MTLKDLLPYMDYHNVRIYADTKKGRIFIGDTKKGMIYD